MMESPKLEAVEMLTLSLCPSYIPVLCSFCGRDVARGYFKLTVVSTTGMGSIYGHRTCMTNKLGQLSRFVKRAK